MRVVRVAKVEKKIIPPGVAALRAHTVNLLKLLDDAELGLFSWHMMLHDTIDEIAAWNGLGPKAPKKEKGAEE